jgi:carboxyl-terminal processing protease
MGTLNTTVATRARHTARRCIADIADGGGVGGETSATRRCAAGSDEDSSQSDSAVQVSSAVKTDTSLDRIHAGSPHIRARDLARTPGCFAVPSSIAMGVPPIGAAVVKPICAHHGRFSLASQKSGLAKSRRAGRRVSVVSRGTRGTSNEGGETTQYGKWKSSLSSLGEPATNSSPGISRGAAAALVSAAAASVLVFGEGLPFGSAIAGFVGGVITGGVPVAFADEDAREDTLLADSNKTAPGVTAAEETPKTNASASNLQIVDEVWKVVDENFLPARADDGFDRIKWKEIRESYLNKPPTTRPEAYETIRAILKTLGDPFSRFVDPSAFAPLLKYDISGVGLNVAEDVSDVSTLKVLGLVLDSPAAKEGVKQGDTLVSVDGVPVKNKSAFQAVSLIQASQSVEVKVGVKSNDSDTERVVTLKRNVNARDPVAFRMEGGGVGYVRLTEFNALAEPNVVNAVDQLRKQGATSFVLDLRDNPGGLVQAGVEIARLFLPPDRNVAFTEGRVVAGGVKGNTTVRVTTDGNGSRKGNETSGVKNSTYLKSIPSASGAPIVTEPLVVLVNGRSASASEILTGALRDNCRATVAGSTTYGKGLIQSVYELSDGSGLVLTVGKYVTPGLHDIDRVGIEADFAMFPGFEKANEKLLACEVPSRK